MNANDLYIMKPESTEVGAEHLIGFYVHHWSDDLSEEERGAIQYEGVDTSKIVVKTVKYFCYDGRRIWQLRTVWFEGVPFMVVQNAGREGDDHSARFITDGETYLKAVDYIKDQVKASNEVVIEVINPNEDLPVLTRFYGQSLDEPFERY